MTFKKGNQLGKANKGKVRSVKTRKKIGDNNRKRYAAGEKFGFQKGHKVFDGAEKGWFTSEQMKGNINGKGNKGKKYKKQSNPCRGMKGNTYGFKKGVPSWNAGKKCPNLPGNKINHHSGENHWNWQGGKSFEYYPEEFFEIREQILERDSFVCQLCKKQILIQTKILFIGIHHIDYNKLNNKPENLVTLCNFCNSRVNFNRKNWQKFFKEVI